MIRPLLDIRRAELRAYLAAAGAAFREDATNADVLIPRNRVRHELHALSRITLFDGNRAVLARAAALAAQDEDFLARRGNQTAPVGSS